MEYINDITFVPTETKWDYLDLYPDTLQDLSLITVKDSLGTVIKHGVLDVESRCDAINIYLIDVGLAGPSHLGVGIPYQRDHSTGYYSRISLSANDINLETQIHEMGHSLGLFHTFNNTVRFISDGSIFYNTNFGQDPDYLQQVSPSYPYGFNCENAGDEVCDTYPSHQFGAVVSGCSIATGDHPYYYMPNNYTQPYTGPSGLVKWPAFYIPSEVSHVNHMSYYPCENHFTPGQSHKIFDLVSNSPALQRASTTLEYSYDLSNASSCSANGNISFHIDNYCVTGEDILIECSNCPSASSGNVYNNLPCGDYNFTFSAILDYGVSGTPIIYCPLEQTTITVGDSFDYGTVETATSSSNYSNQTLSFDDNLVVPAGVFLTISNSTLSFDEDAGITIHPGGTLVLDNTIVQESCCSDSWLGIEVIGTPGQYQGANPNASSPHHGLVKIANNSVVKNAQIGVTNAPRNDNFGYPLHSGGKINTFNASFINCKEAVRLASFVNQTGGTSQEVHCNFRNTNFKWDADYSFANYSPMIRMIGVKHIDILGCDFTNENTALFTGTNNNHSKAAIYMARSSIDMNSSSIPSKITHFNYGIVNFSKTASSIQNTKFSNYRSIYMVKNKASRITENTFENMTYAFQSVAGSESIVQGYTEPWQAHYGIYMDHSTAYWIEGNKFNLPTENIREVGIIIHASGEAYNQVYRNEFIDCHHSIISYDDNRSDADPILGLNILCNDFNNGYNDILVDYIGNEDGGWGISANQGSSEVSAGNQFSVTVPSNEYKLDNFLDHVDYFTYDGENIAQSDVDGDVFVIEVFDQNVCQSQVTKGKNEKVISAMDYKNDATNYRLQLNDLVDGGDTDALTDEVLYADYADALELYYDLMGKSPNLSVKVMQEAIENEYALPPALLTLILKSNPTAGKSSKIQSKLDDRLLPLSEYQRYMIDQGKNLLSEKNFLEAKLAYNELQFISLMNQAINMIIFDDDIVDKEMEINNLIAGYETIDHQYMKIDRALESEDYTLAQSVLNNIPIEYDLRERQNQEWNDYQTAYQMLINIYQNNIETLTPAQIDELLLIAEKNNNSAAGLAWQMLEQYSDVYVMESLTPPGSHLKSLGRTGKGEEINPFEELQYVHVYPNPADEMIILEFVGYEEALTLRLVDIKGNVVLNETFEGKSLQKTLELYSIASGIYSMTLSNNDKVIHSEKLVIKH